MQRIAEYIIKMSPFMVLAIPLFAVIRALYLRLFNKSREINIWHEAAFLAFAVFLTGLASQTILPKIKIDSTGAITFKSYGRAGVNFIPFLVFVQTYKIAFLKGDINYFIINLLGNIGMFMPIGFFAPLLWRSIKLGKATLIGFGVSLFIEVCQLFIARGTDIDDLWLNTLGTVLGYLIYKLLCRCCPTVTDRFKVNNTNSK